MSSQSSLPNPRPIEHCETMADVRRNIDALDRELVALIKTRQGYIEEAGRIKTDKNTVRDEDRINDVLTKVLASAEHVGLNPDIARNTWIALVESSIAYEHIVWDDIHTP